MLSASLPGITTDYTTDTHTHTHIYIYILIQVVAFALFSPLLDMHFHLVSCSSPHHQHIAVSVSFFCRWLASLLLHVTSKSFDLFQGSQRVNRTGKGNIKIRGEDAFLLVFN